MRLNYAQVKQLVSHRHPILLVDRVTEAAIGEWIRAEKNITANEFCYGEIEDEAHDPRAYAYPVTLMLESFCQAAYLLGRLSNSQTLSGRHIPLFGSIHQSTIYREAFPGDKLEHHARIVKNMGEAIVVGGEILINGQIAAEIGMALLMIKPSDAETIAGVKED